MASTSASISAHILRMNMPFDRETINAALNDLHDDIQTYYFDGPRFTSRIVCNERM